jgi:hypothetical protein
MAKRKRREWTKEHVRELKTLARQRTPAARIAKSLKRTLGATRQAGAPAKASSGVPRELSTFGSHPYQDAF